MEQEETERIFSGELNTKGRSESASSRDETHFWVTHVSRRRDKETPFEEMLFEVKFESSSVRLERDGPFTTAVDSAEMVFRPVERGHNRLEVLLGELVVDLDAILLDLCDEVPQVGLGQSRNGQSHREVRFELRLERVGQESCRLDRLVDVLGFALVSRARTVSALDAVRDRVRRDIVGTFARALSSGSIGEVEQVGRRRLERSEIDRVVFESLASPESSFEFFVRRGRLFHLLVSSLVFRSCGAKGVAGDNDGLHDRRADDGRGPAERMRHQTTSATGFKKVASSHGVASQVCQLITVLSSKKELVDRKSLKSEGFETDEGTTSIRQVWDHVRRETLGHRIGNSVERPKRSPP